MVTLYFCSAVNVQSLSRHRLSFLDYSFFMLDMFCDIERAAADADVAVYLAAAALWGLTVISQQLAHQLGQEGAHVRRLLSGGCHQTGSRTFLP